MSSMSTQMHMSGDTLHFGQLAHIAGEIMARQMRDSEISLTQSDKWISGGFKYES